MIDMRLNFYLLVFLLIHSVLDVYGQHIGDVYVYDSTLSRFSDYDFDDQGNLLFSGYVGPRNATGTDPFGNLSFDGYWYENGLTCKADSTVDPYRSCFLGAHNPRRAGCPGHRNHNR